MLAAPLPGAGLALEPGVLLAVRRLLAVPALLAEPTKVGGGGPFKPVLGLGGAPPLVCLGDPDDEEGGRSLRGAVA